MTAPGGNEVSRVSVRVSPDTDQFREELRAQLEGMTDLTVEVKVEFNLDPEDLRARLAAMNESIRVEVNVEQPDVDNSVTIRAELEIDNAHFRAQIARLEPVRLRAELDIDSDRLEQSVRNAGGGSGGGGSGGGISPRIILNFAQMLAIAPALIVAGAGITAAWGAISTAVAAIPAALGLLAAPIGVIALGFDAIKAQAQQLNPVIDSLVARIESGFNNDFAFVFQNVGEIIDFVDDRLVRIGDTVGGVAIRLSEFFNTDTSKLQMSFALEAINQGIIDLAPGIEDLLDMFIRLISTGGAVPAIVDPIVALFDRLNDSLLQLDINGTLGDAFAGLGDVLSSLAVGLADLVTNGIEVFAAAAPGVTAFLDELTGFFGRFDWDSLGTSVGMVFSGLGETLANVDVGTIRGIETAFRDMGELFQSSDFQANLDNIVDGLPATLDLITEFSDGFAQIGSDLSGAIQLYDKASDKFKVWSDTMTGYAEDLGRVIPDTFKTWLNDVDTMLDESFEKWTGLSATEIDNMFGEADSALAGGEERGRRGGGGYFGGAEQGIVESGGKAADAAGKSAQDIDQKVTDGLKPIPENAKGIADQLAPILSQAFDQLGAATPAEMGKIATAVATGFTGIQDAMRVGFQSIQPIVDESFGLLKTSIDTKMTEIGTAVTTGFEPVTTGLKTSFADLTTAVLTSVQNMALAVANGLASIQNSFAVQDITIVEFGLSFVALSLVVQNAMLMIVNSVNTGFAQITLSTVTIQNQLLVLTTAFSQAALLVSNAMTAMSTAVLTNVNLIISYFVLLQAALLALGIAFQNLVTMMLAQLQLLLLGFQTTFDQIVLIVQNALLLITDAFAKATLEWITLVTAAMAQMLIAVQNGMDQCVLAVQDATLRMTDALNAAVPAFAEAGANMGQGLADGLRSKQGEVEAAATALANAAAEAVRAASEIASPSKVFTRLGEFMGLGVAVGFDNSKSTVGRSARGVVSAIVDTVSKVANSLEGTDLVSNLAANMPSKFSSTVDGDFDGAITSDGFGSISDRVGEALEGWTVQIDGNGMAKLVNKSNTRKARRG